MGRSTREEDSPPFHNPALWYRIHREHWGLSNYLATSVCARGHNDFDRAHCVMSFGKGGPCSLAKTHKSDLPHLSSEGRVKTGRTTDDASMMYGLALGA